MVQTVTHARELARFLDEAVTQGADLRKLRDLATGAFAAHWQEVLAFLGIVAEQWPPLLAAEGAIEPAARRDAYLRAAARMFAADPPQGQIVAAGSTGSIPATADLLKTVAHLPRGAVVLPALDTNLDPESWTELDAGHAQYGLKHLLEHIGIEREDVAPWPALPGKAPAARVRFLSEALRPPPTTDAWRDLAEHVPGSLVNALDGLSLIEAKGPREEALVIACALRETLETEGRTAALVTPDRGLARGVAAELERWEIGIDDSAGRKLSATPPGAFLVLLAHAAAEDFAPVALLALLKHPFAAGGEDRAEFRRTVHTFETWCLRGLRPEPGLKGLSERLISNDKAPDYLKRWLMRLIPRLEPFAKAMQESDAALSDLARAHGLAAEALAASGDDKAGQDRKSVV